MKPTEIPIYGRCSECKTPWYTEPELVPRFKKLTFQIKGVKVTFTKVDNEASWLAVCPRCKSASPGLGEKNYRKGVKGHV